MGALKRRPRSLLAAAATFLVIGLANLANAEEVTVKNDSFVDGGSAVIVGDFIPGEQAGARLTSPCDGNIVAVQIAWLEGSPGHGQSIEEAIHIYDGGSFPSPGSELETLLGPVMSPGFFNEFRYVDEAQSIPLSVPVTTGQQFYVTIEFANGTDVGNGGPSVVRDINGCQGGKNVLYAIPGGWLNFCLFLQGDLLIRAVIDCTEISGACCMPDGSCVEATPTDCIAQSGTPQGDFTTCATTSCPQPSGACCFPATGGCLNLTETNCLTAGGTWAGFQTDCATYVCFPIGACCLTDGSCENDLSPDDCSALGGTFMGDGSTCGTVTCPDPDGACCFSTGGCLVFSEANCTIAGGTWMGPGSDCTDSQPNGTADVCESSCVGDLDGDGDVDLSDLSAMLAHYPTVSGASYQDGDLDGDGDVDLSDLSAILSVYDTTCP